jgi:hypothetical protein
VLTESFQLKRDTDREMRATSLTGPDRNKASYLHETIRLPSRPSVSETGF